MIKQTTIVITEAISNHPKPQNYLLDYRIVDATGKTVKEGTMRARNKTTVFEAKVGLGSFLEKQYPGNIVYLLSCKPEVPDLLTQVLDTFLSRSESF